MSPFESAHFQSALDAEGDAHLVVDLFFGVHQLETELPQEGRHEELHLEEGNVLSETEARPRSQSTKLIE